MNQNILVTGDYWHRDFKLFLSGFDAFTLVPIDKISNVQDDQFDLVVIAQSRRDQYPLETIEQMHQQFGNTPIVAVLGSWCEGEVRSGHPWPGVPRVYWHQWQGRFETFVGQLNESGITNWHAPRTASGADRILGPHFKMRAAKINCVGISSWTRTQFDMLQDAILQFGWQSHWVEHSAWDTASSQILNPICIDADSYTQELENRIDWLKSKFPTAGFVLVMSFPRIDEVDQLRQKGIMHVVSKPFELDDLKSALTRAFESSNKSAEVSAEPKQKE